MTSPPPDIPPLMTFPTPPAPSLHFSTFPTPVERKVDKKRENVKLASLHFTPITRNHEPATSLKPLSIYENFVCVNRDDRPSIQV